MSTNLELHNTEIIPNSSTTVVESSEYCIDPQTSESIVEGVKKEYSIVGDGLYASINTDEAPEWLTSIIDNLVDNAISSGMIDYDLLVQDVRNAIDSIDVASNTYVEQININAIVDGIVVSKLETLNATLGNTYATIVNLNTAIATTEEAMTLYTSDLVAEFNDTIGSRITSVELAYANADESLATSIDTLNSRITSQDGELSGNANAISGLQTYVGLDTSNNPNGTGALSRIEILENQNDGVVEFVTGDYDVMLNVDVGDTDPDDDELDVTKEPYATWIAADTINSNDLVRRDHIGDVYIQYDSVTGGYVKSYKFIKTAADATVPFATDADGYTWSIISDTDAQSAYIIALQAKDLADQKRRVFLIEPFGPYEEGDLWIDSSNTPQVIKVTTVDRDTGYSSSDWVLADQQAQDFISNVYNPDKIRIDNQIDGKIEYNFYENFSEIIDPVTSTGSISEARALEVIKEAWNTTALKDDANGNVVYFKDSENAFWYQARTDLWLAITDTSIYRALQEAVNARGAADGKVSQFYAWGGPNAPADYIRNPNDPVEDQVTIKGDTFVYWYKSDGALYYNFGSTWELVPTAPSSSVYVAEGDLLTVFDPEIGDTTNYSFNGTSWQISGPVGVVSNSQFFVDLENDVKGPNGFVAGALSALVITNEAYVDSEIATVKSSFIYDSTLEINGTFYNSGFGLNVSGVGDITQPNDADGLTSSTAFDSEFFVNAERFVLKSPSFPNVSAVFKVTSGGIQLGVENTEATRNVAQGDYSSAVTYVKGDIVLYDGSSYTALRTTLNDTPDSSPSDWQLLAAKGLGGGSTSAIDLIADTSAILYDTAGSKETETITLNTFTRGTSGTLTYQFYVNDVSQGAPSSTNSLTYTPSQNYSLTPISVKVELREDNVVTARDEVTLYPVKAGSDTITAILSNDSHTMSANSSGTVSTYEGSGTTIEVYQGATKLIFETGSGSPSQSGRYKVSPSVASVVMGNITGNGTDIATVAQLQNMTADNARITYNIAVINDVGQDIAIKKIQSFSKSRAGGEGDAGRNNATVFLYRRKVGTAPAEPTTTSTYNFSTKILTGFNNSWTTTVPDGDTPLYVIAATASSVTDTDDILASDWSDASLLSSSGTDGLNSATVYLYQRKTSVPSKPSGVVVYTFEDGTTSGVDNGWERVIPAGVDPLYVTFATAVSTGPTDNLTTSEWVDPEILVRDGTKGLNNATVYIYKRANTTPDLPTTQSTYNFETKLLNGVNNSWSRTVPDGTLPLYVSAATASSIESSDTIEANEWADAVVLATLGVDGLNSASISLYQRKSSTPPVPSANITYTFDTGNTSAINNNWSRTILAGDDPLYITTATAISTGATDVITSNEWATPEVLAQDGNNGLNNATLFLYQRKNVVPSVPSSLVTYTFSAKSIIGFNNGWSDIVPSGNDPLYVTVATASSSSNSDNIASNEWTPPRVMSENGVDGLNTASISLYKRASSLPAVPSSTIDYNFTTGAITNINNSWSTTILEGSDPLYIITATAISDTNTDSIPSGEWANPKILVKDGADGDSYTGTTEFYKLTNSSTAPTVASGSWLTTPQTPTANNRYLWNYNKNTRSIGADIDSPVSLITQYVKDGKGISGINEEYQRGTSATTAPTGTWASTFSGAGAVSETLPYMWNRTTISYTEGADTITVTMIAARGTNGTNGINGVGEDGSAGAGMYGATYVTISTSTVDITQKFTAVAGRPPVNGDIFTQKGAISGISVKQYDENNNLWEDPALFVDGSIIASETVGGDKIIAGTSLTAPIMKGGRVELVGTSHMRILSSTGVGSNNQFIEWFGPKLITGSNTVDFPLMTENNAITYVKTNGDAYFGGTLTAGIQKEAAFTGDKNLNPELIIGPFSSSGGSREVTVGFLLEGYKVESGTCATSYTQPSAVLTIGKSTDGINWTNTLHNLSGSTSKEQDFGPTTCTTTEEMTASINFTDNVLHTGDQYYKATISNQQRYHSVSNIVNQKLSILSVEE